MGRVESDFGAYEPIFLIVDDDAQVRSIIAEYLQSFGFHRVLQVKDGQEALRYIHDNDQPLDIILSDWEMPRIDGLTLLKALRNQVGRKDTKFVMITSQASRERMKVSQAIQLRVDDYIVKPFAGDVFRKKISALVANILAARQSNFND